MMVIVNVQPSHAGLSHAIRELQGGDARHAVGKRIHEQIGLHPADFGDAVIVERHSLFESGWGKQQILCSRALQVFFHITHETRVLI